MSKLLSKIKSTVSQNLVNMPGWRTKRKILIIESDDWGSIRMPSSEVYDNFISEGFNIQGSIYNRFDTLETNDDLSHLYEVLRSHSDSSGNHAVITANCVVGNPDFKRIKASGFTEYHYEEVPETLKQYKGRDQVESLWKEGLKESLFHPQFHGREHVNVIRWMEALRKGGKEIMFTFNENTTFSGDGDYNFMEVLDFNSPDDLLMMKQSLVEGLDVFEKIFGFRSRSFIPPCYTWNSDIEKTLSDSGVKYIQGLVVQLVPTGTFGNYTKKYHFLGNKNAYGQYFLIRNAFFEPSLIQSTDPVGECLKRIDIAFKWNKPAIIGSHRINFMGGLNERNRSENLKLLNTLLGKILQRWPDVEFMSSDKLGDLISKKT